MAVDIARVAAVPLRLHQRLAPAPVPVCTFWLQGRCTKNSCRFSHPPLPTADQAHCKPVPASSQKVAPPRRRILRRPDFKYEGEVEEADKRKPQHPQNYGPACAESSREMSTGQGSTSHCALIASLTGHPSSPIRGISLPRSSTTLFTAGQDGFLKGWDCTTGVCAQLLSLGQPANCLFNSFDDPNWLFVGLATEIRVINVLAGNIMQQQSLPVGSPVLSLTSMGDLLLAGLEQGSILIWKFNVATVTFVPAACLSPAKGCLNGAVLTLEPVASSSSTQATSGKVFSGYADGTLCVWNLSTGKCEATCQAHHGAVSQILTCGVDWVLSASQVEGKVALWRINVPHGMQTGSHLLELLSTRVVSDGERCLIRPIVMCGRFEKDNRPTLFVAYNSNTVQALELPALTEITGKLCSENAIEAMEIGPQNMLFLGCRDGCLAIWSWRREQMS